MYKNSIHGPQLALFSAEVALDSATHLANRFWGTYMRQDGMKCPFVTQPESETANTNSQVTRPTN